MNYFDRRSLAVADQVETSWIDKIDEASLEGDPFDHIYVRNVFSPAEYFQLLNNLPQAYRYCELRHPDAIRPDGSCARLKFLLHPEHLLFLPKAERAFWSRLSRRLRAPELQAAFKAKFRTALERRFGRGIDRLSFRPVAMLVRDMSGYRIGIHADSPLKAITVQFYLPGNESQLHLGTLFHHGQDGEAAERIRALDFRPASVYAFPVQPGKSWHSVAALSDRDGERNSLMLTYFVQEGLKGRLLDGLRRIKLFLEYVLTQDRGKGRR